MAGVCLRLAVAVPSALALPASGLAGPADEARALADRAMVLLRDAERAADPVRAREAAGAFERAALLDPNQPDHRFHRVLAYAVARDEDRARAALKDLGDALTDLAGPNAAGRDPRPLYASALIHAHFGSNVAEALRLLSLLKNRQPDFMAPSVRSLEFHCRVALTAQMLRARPANDNEKEANQREAVQQAKQAVALVEGDSREPIARRNLAQVYRLTDRWAESEVEFRTLAQRFPRDAVVRYGLASVLADQHRYEDACVAWEQFLKVVAMPDSIDPRELDSVADGRMRYGVSLIHAGHEERGLAEVRAYLAQHPTDPRGWYYVGRTLLEREDDAAAWAEAERCLLRARELDPWCAGPLQDLRRLYQKVRPDPEKLAPIAHELDDPERQRARKQVMDKRKRDRPDGTNGCE